jgi:hypothetical protein
MRLILLFSYLVASLMVISCKKSETISPMVPIAPPSPPLPPLPPSPPSSPIIKNFNVYTDQDIMVELPIRECQLVGGYSYEVDNYHPNFTLKIATSWTKISGPASYKIDNPDSNISKLSNLEKGVYEFELKGSFQDSLYRDTLKIIVDELSTTPNEIITNNLTWYYPWYNTLFIKNFYELAPGLKPGRFFKLYINRPPSSAWIEVYPISSNETEYAYYYSKKTGSTFEKGTMSIFYFGSETNDKPKVKILY